MSSGIASNLSALHALGLKQSVTSNNIANLNSKEFKKSRATQEENLNGAVSSRVQQVNTPGVMVTKPDGSLEELSNVDLSLELTEMIPTQRGYEANLKATQIQGRVEDSILDLIG
jgi:flagellar basal body rod protein FlgG